MESVEVLLCCFCLFYLLLIPHWLCTYSCVQGDNFTKLRSELLKCLVEVFVCIFAPLFCLTHVSPIDGWAKGYFQALPFTPVVLTGLTKEHSIKFFPTFSSHFIFNLTCTRKYLSWSFFASFWQIPLWTTKGLSHHLETSGAPLSLEQFKHLRGGYP